MGLLAVHFASSQFGGNFFLFSLCLSTFYRNFFGTLKNDNFLQNRLHWRCMYSYSEGMTNKNKQRKLRLFAVVGTGFNPRSTTVDTAVKLHERTSLSSLSLSFLKVEGRSFFFNCLLALNGGPTGIYIFLYTKQLRQYIRWVSWWNLECKITTIQHNSIGNCDKRKLRWFAGF